MSIEGPIVPPPAAARSLARQMAAMRPRDEPGAQDAAQA